MNTARRCSRTTRASLAPCAPAFRGHRCESVELGGGPGTFVIILGEMILRLTNGLYRSAMHRVAKNTSGRSRYSMPTFFDPGYDHRVACVPSCRPAHGEPRYRACTVAEHMREMAHTTLSTAEPILAV
jgi:isopenicillin N synthase-like dioxygenase